MTGSSLEIDTNEEGIAECLWTLAGGALEQQVKAELVECRTDTKLPPIYFGATMSGRGMSANSGELNLIIPAPRGNFPLEYGPFDHHLVGLKEPPALLLGLITLSNEFNQIKYTEDYDTKGFTDLADIGVHFKPVQINVDTFRVQLWVSQETRGLRVGDHTGNTIELNSNDLKREMGEGFDLHPIPYVLDNDTRVSLRWWAIPAEEQGHVDDTLPS